MDNLNFLIYLITQTTQSITQKQNTSQPIPPQHILVVYFWLATFEVDNELEIKYLKDQQRTNPKLYLKNLNVHLCRAEEGVLHFSEWLQKYNEHFQLNDLSTFLNTFQQARNDRDLKAKQNTPNIIIPIQSPKLFTKRYAQRVTHHFQRVQDIFQENRLQLEALVISHFHIEQLKTSSIRGRMALAITCLETILSSYDLPEADKVSLFDILWQFVEQKDLFDWENAQQDHPLLTEIERHESPKTEPFRNGLLPNWVCGLIIEIVCSLGRSVLFGFQDADSLWTYSVLLDVVYMTAYKGFPLPAFTPFLKSSFNENEGYGNPVPRTFFKS